MNLLDKYHTTPKEELMEQLNKLKELVDKQEKLTILELFHYVKHTSLLYSLCVIILCLFIFSFKKNSLEDLIFMIELFLFAFFSSSILFMFVTSTSYTKKALNKLDLISHFNQKDELIIQIIEFNSIKDEFLIEKFRKAYSKLQSEICLTEREY